MDEIANRLEHNLISNDIGFWLEVVSTISKQKAGGPLIFGFLPYISLFMYETSLYLGSKYPEYRKTLPEQQSGQSLNKHTNIIRASRMKVKLFDDTNHKVSGSLTLLDWMNTFHANWYINSHKGWLSPLKKSLQADLGVFTYNGHIVSSTHTGLLLTGLGKDELMMEHSTVANAIGETLLSIGYELGSYLKNLSKLPEFTHSQKERFQFEIKPGGIKFRDLKSAKFFNSIFNGPGSVLLNSSLFLFLTTINFVRYVLQPSLNGFSDTAFKIKFIMLYHLTSSVRKLQSYYYPKRMLTDKSKSSFQAVLKDDSLKQLASKKKLRNIFVHYTVDSGQAILIKSQTNLQEIVEHHFDGEMFTRVDSRINEQIERVSTVLEEWMNWPVDDKKFKAFST